jgi:hypothetical protein
MKSRKEYLRQYYLLHKEEIRLKNSKKIKKCIDCNKKISNHATRCRSCANSINALIDGRTLKDFHCIDCDKIITYGSKSGRCKSCNGKYQFEVNGNIAQRPEVRQKMSKQRKGRKLSQEWKNKIRNSMLGKHAGKLNPMFGKSTLTKGRGRRIRYKNIYFRSFYEFAYAKYLDKNKIKWQYEYKRFNLDNCTYCPDFYLPETNEYIEIKGWLTPIAKNKIKLFRKIYKDLRFKILYKKDLQKIGVL